MWQGICMTYKWNLSCYSPRVQAVWFGFRWFVHGGRGSTAAVLRLDTALNQSRKNMADSVTTRFPARLRSRDGELRYYGRLEYDFLAFWPRFLLLTFLIFSVLIPVCLSPSCSFVCAAVIGCPPTSNTCPCWRHFYGVISILPHLGIPFVLFYSSEASF